TDENTIADSIAVGIPRNPVKGLRAVTASKGAYITVSDAAILKAIKTLGNDEGIFTEPAAAAPVAGLKKALATSVITKNESVSVILSGNGLKDPDTVKDVLPAPAKLDNDIDALHTYLETRGGNTE
ncbi:MAG: pyridoxal-phosphate dependent enzyme, partial [Candidatus Hydrogenedentota bacterium]